MERREQNGFRNLLNDYLTQISNSNLEVVNEKHAWRLVSDYCSVKYLDKENFYDWLKLVLPKWYMEHTDSILDIYPTVKSFFNFLDQQAQEMLAIDALIEELS